VFCFFERWKDWKSRRTYTIEVCYSQSCLCILLIKKEVQKNIQKNPKNFKKGIDNWDWLWYTTWALETRVQKTTVLENWTTNWENEIKISLITLNTKY
jgi:hypothetical protein